MTPFHPCPKLRPRLLDKQDKAADLAKRERVEDARVKKRSGGRCEVVEDVAGGWVELRCPRRASSIHHLRGGTGRRRVGVSILAEHKLHVCDGPKGCHPLITGKVLIPIGAPSQRESAATVIFERIL